MKANVDNFTWSYNEMPVLPADLITHSLNVDPTTNTVKQPARKFKPKIEKMVIVEVPKLIDMRFIKEEKFLTWKSSIVSVVKKKDQLRIYVDFRDLNKACSKDDFPLPNMDLMIDSTFQSDMFSFMDGCNGYN